MITKEQIFNLAQEAVQDSDRFIVDVKVKPNSVIEVFVDADSAVSIDHCVEISRFIESHLDRDAEDFELSVFSYGLSGALVMDRQLTKYLEKDIEVKTKEQGKIQGKLVSFDDQSITITPTPPKRPSKRKPAVEGNQTFQRDTVSIFPAILF